MARWVLNTFSTFEIVLLFVCGSALLAMGCVLVAQRYVAGENARRLETVSSGLRIVYELLFVLILTFGISLVLDKLDDAQQTVDREAAALTQLRYTNLGFHDGDQQRFAQGIEDYVDAVVQDEWPAMRDGGASLEAQSALETLYAEYEESSAAGRAPPEAYRQALDHLDDVTIARRERLSLRDARLPSILAVMLPLGALLLLILEFRPGLGLRSQLALAGTLAVVLSSTYLLTIVLDYPFSGGISIGNEALTSGGLAFIDGDELRAPQPGDRQLPLTRRRLTGVWDSGAYGTTVLEPYGRRGMRGAYRSAHGTIDGVIEGGVFRGTWCEGPKRDPAHGEAGLVEWRLVRTSSGDRLVTGKWRVGYARRPDGSFKAAPDGGWDLHELKIDQASDLKRRLKHDPAAWYCHAP